MVNNSPISADNELWRCVYINDPLKDQEFTLISGIVSDRINPFAKTIRGVDWRMDRRNFPPAK
jgi:hypothetical protein